MTAAVPAKNRFHSVLDVALHRIGLERRSDPSRDLEPAFVDLYQQCAPFTMTSIERMYALHQAVSYVSRRGVEGDIVECGVWRGGSSLMAALTLRRRGDAGRRLWLYDTFEGMSKPTPEDGSGAYAEWAHHQTDGVNAWCYSSLGEVRSNLFFAGLVESEFCLVKGKVEETIPETSPERIAVLRLDTDWYASTRHELEHLYPRLTPGGVLIIDDYGHWQGARRAVDEYFKRNGIHVLLSRIDYTGRIGVKLP